ncbi:hypothetical protein QQX98_012419, partial [Neonectria punicea]
TPGQTWIQHLRTVNALAFLHGRPAHLSKAYHSRILTIIHSRTSCRLRRLPAHSTIPPRTRISITLLDQPNTRLRLRRLLSLQLLRRTPKLIVVIMSKSLMRPCKIITGSSSRRRLNNTRNILSNIRNNTRSNTRRLNIRSNNIHSSNTRNNTRSIHTLTSLSTNTRLRRRIHPTNSILRGILP